MHWNLIAIQLIFYNSEFFMTAKLFGTQHYLDLFGSLCWDCAQLIWHLATVAHRTPKKKKKILMDCRKFFLADFNHVLTKEFVSTYYYYGYGLGCFYIAMVIGLQLRWWDVYTSGVLNVCLSACMCTCDLALCVFTYTTYMWLNFISYFSRSFNISLKLLLLQVWP